MYLFLLGQSNCKFTLHPKYHSKKLLVFYLFDINEEKKKVIFYCEDITYRKCILPHSSFLQLNFKRTISSNRYLQKNNNNLK
jgi:hypothetical protein